MHQRIRHHNQHPTGTAGVQLIVKNQAGLNGFTQPHFVRQQNPGCVTCCHFVGNVNLVWQVLCARTDQALSRGCPQSVKVLRSGHPQAKRTIAIKLAGKQPLMGGGKIHRTAEFYLGNLGQVFPAVIGVVHQHTTDVLHGSHSVAFAVKGLDRLTNLVDDPRQRGIVDGVGALLVRRRETQRYTAA